MAHRSGTNQRLPQPGAQTSRDATAKCAKHARIVRRKLWMATGFAGCPHPKRQSCFAARPAPFAFSTAHDLKQMARITNAIPASTVFTFSQMESYGLESHSILACRSAAHQRLRPLPTQRTVDLERHVRRLSLSPHRYTHELP